MMDINFAKGKIQAYEDVEKILQDISNQVLASPKIDATTLLSSYSVMSVLINKKIADLERFTSNA